MLIFIFMLQFVALFFCIISVLGNDMFWSLTDFSANIVSLSRLQTIYFVFSKPENNFFKYFSSPILKNNGSNDDGAGKKNVT